jgi:hypothetical protein
MTQRMALAGVVVGRDEELERLSRFVGDLDALPGVLLLEGGAGIGKTTLWRAGLAAAESAGFLVVRCQVLHSRDRPVVRVGTAEASRVAVETSPTMRKCKT